MYTDPQKEQYFITDITVKDVVRNLENDSYEYYYYLSDKKSENNIQDWVKIKENQTNSDNLAFKIDTRDISNFDELSNSTVLFLYIKEVAVKGGDQKVITSDAMKFENNSDTEIYLDDVKVEINDDNSNNNINNNNNNNNNNNGTNNTDDTVSKDKIPDAGKTVIQIIIITGIIALLIVSFRKFKDFKELK